MARIILKSPYLKPASKSRAANHLRYIATREGVVKPEDSKRQLPATHFQKQAIAELLKEYPDTAELYEHQDYLQSPTRETPTSSSCALPKPMVSCSSHATATSTI